MELLHLWHQEGVVNQINDMTLFNACNAYKSIPDRSRLVNEDYAGSIQSCFYFGTLFYDQIHESTFRMLSIVYCRVLSAEFQLIL